uniref:Cytosolic carboxypeptidase N-terminal domain-containing protein n=1 Tax=Varanus komodoensis TaxID=61221 RepID=A0A8D2L1K0_VARKO
MHIFISTGSDIGIDEIITGNLSKYAAIPPGYLAQPKKGHLVFDACFESGNLGRVDYITEFEYDLFIRPDTCNPRFRVWFNFTVENVKESQLHGIVLFQRSCTLICKCLCSPNGKMSLLFSLGLDKIFGQKRS